MLDTYLQTIPSAMHRAKARTALEAMVCVNGADRLVPRHSLIEGRVALGAKVLDRRGDMVLMNADGSWLDQRNATKHGLNYAAWLSVRVG